MPEGDIQYRYGQLEDCEAIALLGAHVFTISFAQLLPAKDLQKYLLESYSTSSIAAKLEHPSSTFVVAIYDDNLVGFMQLTQGASETCIDDVKSKIQLQRLYVSEKCQGMGIGTRLMKKAEIEAHKMGIKNIWLATWESNPKAERIYEKAGFVKVGSMKFMLGDTALKDWVMIKAL